MAGDYEILNARVKQKVDTEANWLDIEDLLGPILEGEQAFVINDSGVGVNFKIGDGTKKFSELPYFIAYYSDVTNQRVLFYLDGGVDVTIASTFRLYSKLQDIILNNTSGSPINLKIGTTPGGGDICSQFPVANGINNIAVNYDFAEPVTVYVSGLAGKTYTMIVTYFQYDQAPASPPAGTTTPFRWPKGHQGIFYPVSSEHLAATWDFGTGQGKPGTLYENCVLMGTNDVTSMANAYPVGYADGDALKALKGNAASQITLLKANLPSIPITFGLDFKGGTGGIKVLSQNNPGPYGVSTAVELGGSSQPVDIRPRSIVSLWYVAITD